MPSNAYIELPPLPIQHPGHYSAPSSPPLLHQKPYARKKSITAHLLDEDPPLLKAVMRRNSSAVIYRETSPTRRMSMVLFILLCVMCNQRQICF
jgi:hypothetical protein